MSNKIEDAQLKAMINFIKESAKLPEDERVRTAYEKVAASAELGYKNMADNEEKKAWLNYVLCDQSYRLGFYLWRHQELPPALSAELFKFMLPEEAIEIARGYGQADRDADAELSKQHLEIEKRRKGIEVFQSILAGDDVETAKKKMEEYEERQAKVLGELNNQQQAPAMQ